MAESSKTTTNHKEIRKWIKERGGHPALVKGSGEQSRFSKFVKRNGKD